MDIACLSSRQEHHREHRPVYSGACTGEERGHFGAGTVGAGPAPAPTSALANTVRIHTPNQGIPNPPDLPHAPPVHAKYSVRPSITRAELTDRERECLLLAGVGMNDREIGKELGLAATTVHTHIEKSMMRFGVHRRIQAVMRAIMSGAISLGDLAARWEASDRKRKSAVRHIQGAAKAG